MRLGLFLFTILSVAVAPSQTPVVRQGRNVLWHDPGAVETLDFRFGPGGAAMAPRTPFTFIDEDMSGTTAKVKVKDADGREYVVKFGDEASADTFATRMAWATGYYVTPNYFVSEGTISGARALIRAKKAIDPDGRFSGGRFQLRSGDMKYLRFASWSWTDNPFLGAPELKGLKILMMLLSNWDNKDARDAERRGTNAAVSSKDGLLFYFVDDWGGSMGNWGNYFTRSKWDAGDFRRQSDSFVRSSDGRIEWGYRGQHSSLMSADVTYADVEWLMRYLGRITDAQLREGLSASGASPAAAGYFSEAIRQRIERLRNLK
jgi:hypothetical protein